MRRAVARLKPIREENKSRFNFRHLVALHRRWCESLRVAGRVLEDHAGLLALAVGVGLPVGFF